MESEYFFSKNKKLHVYIFIDVDFLCSEQLDRRTIETQKLIKEVGNATREALKRFGSAYGNSSSGESSLRSRF